MINNFIATHHIQKHIITALTTKRTARFRDLRPPKVDTNLYAYHLKLLQRHGLVEKNSEGYTLTQKGVVYINRVSIATNDVRQQPKIVTMFVIQNSDGRVLLSQRVRQPFIEQWALPNGNVQLTDISAHESARREVREKFSIKTPEMMLAGQCYIRTVCGGEVVMSAYAHVFKFNSDDITPSDTLRWVKPHELHLLDLAPAVDKIIARTFFNDPYFFEEYEQNW